jgi:ribosomal protein S6--L-glutamate ligase
MQLLTRRDVDVPRTVCAKSPAGLTSALSFVGGTPAIVKLQQGAQGIGTMIAETPQALTSLLETLWAMGQDIILQEYISESKGRDIRAFVVGGKVIASMRRQAKAGEFRSNLHRGGEGVAVGLDREYARTAVLAAKIMGLDVCGVDMLEGRDGPKVLEINSSPGLEGIERTSGVDVATALIKHGEKLYAARTMRGALSPDSEVSTDRVPLEPVPNPRSRAARKTAAAPRKTAAKTAVKTAAKTAAKAAPKAAAKTAPKTAAKTAVKTATKTARKTAKTA